MHRALNLGFVAALLLNLAACAVVEPGVRTRHFLDGRPNPLLDRQVAQKAMKAEVDPGPAVLVLQGRTPPGINISDDGRKISVAPAFEGVYEVIGTAESDYLITHQSATMKNYFWTWSYKQTWRKALCWPQAPLKLLTLGIWAFFVPLAYPCYALPPSEESGKRLAHYKMLRKAAKAMGGNLVLLTGHTDLVLRTAQGKVVAGSRAKTIKAKAFILRVDRAKQRDVQKGKAAPTSPAVGI